MAKRIQLGGRFLRDQDSPEFFTSGCQILDCVMGGGYPERRITNIVGDKSTGKTLLATEAMINFSRKHRDGYILYVEAESAFDLNYASNLGLDKDSVELIEDVETVEDLFEVLDKLVSTDIDKDEEMVPTLVVVDSLDALSDRAELARGLDESTYGAEKPKKLSQAFRRLIRRLKTHNVTMIIISQIRDKIGATFGRKYSRSGGKALDFYASLVLYLADTGKRYKEIGQIKRPIGANIKIKCEKNKVGLPFRECDVPLLFGYGIEDAEANITYLKQAGQLELLNKELGKRKLKLLPAKPNVNTYLQLMSDTVAKEVIARVTRSVWDTTETEFIPPIGKYGP